jgi:hypothetical protein
MVPAKTVLLSQSPQIHQISAKVASLALRRVVSCLSVMTLRPWPPGPRPRCCRQGWPRRRPAGPSSPAKRPIPANQIARPEVAAHQRWDLLDPVLATGTPASLSQEAAPRPVRALARRGSGTSPGRWLYTLPGVADHPFASPEDADPLPRPPWPGRHLRRARRWPLRSPAARIPTRPSWDTSPGSADWPTYMITSARRFA